MNKKIGIISIASISVLSLLASITASLAWFQDNSLDGIDQNISGKAESAYFAYGDGTPEHPYGISTGRQLYNLAWLQYLGTFNTDSNSDGVIDKQYYFELANDVDATGYTLPPIGTEEYPFVGNFDGKNKTISNLVVSNKEADYGSAKPTLSEAFVEPEIIGFFGVVGKLDDLPYTYNSSINSMNDFTLNNLTVVSKTTETLVGLAAGYVNGDMSGVKINGSATLNVNDQVHTAKTAITDKITDYGLVGYTTKSGNNGTYQQNLSEFYTNGEGQGDTGWGGSINMSGLYNRLNVYEEEYYSDYTDRPEVTGKNYAGKVNSWFRSDLNRDFHYLAGTGGTIGTSQIRGTDITYTISNNIQNGFYIYAGNNYLSLSDDGEQIVHTSTPKNLWSLTNGTDGYLYTITNARWAFSNNNSLERSGVVRLLLFSGGILQAFSLTPDLLNVNSQWTINENNKLVRKSSTTDVLCFNGSDWVVRKNGVGDSGFKLYYGNPVSYLGVSPSAYTFGHTSEDATIFKFVASGSAYKVGGATSSGTLRYFYYRNNEYLPYTSNVGTGHSMVTFSAANGSTTVTPRNGAFLGQSSSYRVKYSGGKLIRETGNAGNSTSYIKLEEYSEDITAASLDSNHSIPQISWTINNKVSDTETYIPLNVAGNSLAASNQNVGYIVSGSNYSAPNGYYNSDIRVSRYSYGELNASIAENDITVYTINNANGSVGRKAISDTLIVGDDPTTSIAADTISSFGFTKYYDYTMNDENKTGARTAFFNTLNQDKNYVHGLHFMNASVGVNNTFDATNVRINGVSYPNETSTTYELPRDCIDFNLKKDGVITFFAGTYFSVGTDDSENNCFFSLSEVNRTGSNIDTIQSIYKIYQNKTDKSIVYTYNSSSTYPTSDYDLKFDTEWISNPSSSYWTNNAVYYFEIPVKEGEYALGSVDENGKNGAYLMYLDIAANGDEGASDVVNVYSITTVKSANPYPTGVDFAPVAIGNNGGESFGIFIASGKQGTITFVVGTGDVNITDTSAISTYSFHGSKYSASDPPDGNFSVSGNSPGEIVIPAAGGERVLTINLTTTNGNEYSIRITDQLTDSSGSYSESSSTYELDSGSGFVTSSKAEIEALSSEIKLADFRSLVTAVVLTRESGNEEFTTEYVIEDCRYSDKVVATNVTANDTTISIEVTSGYTFTIGGVTYSDGDTYPSA